MSSPHIKHSSGGPFSVKYHIVWCPKYRKNVLIQGIDIRLKALLHKVAENIGATIHALEVMPDHVHIFIESDPTWAPCDIANRLKGATARSLRQEYPALKRALRTLWSRSYYVGTVGHVSDATVRRYIALQKVRAK